MPRSLRAVICVRCCNFSRDQGGRAKFEYRSATCRLPDNLSASMQRYQCQWYVITNISTCSRRWSFDLAFSQTQDYPTVDHKTYRGLSGHHQLMFCCLERRGFNQGRIPSRVPLLTSEDLNSSISKFFPHESFQPLPGFLDVLNRKKILYQDDCVALSKVTPPGEGTHAIVAGRAFESPVRAW
jgi:hypothetical protein